MSSLHPILSPYPLALFGGLLMTPLLLNKPSNVTRVHGFWPPVLLAKSTSCTPLCETPPPFKIDFQSYSSHLHTFSSMYVEETQPCKIENQKETCSEHPIDLSTGFTYLWIGCGFPLHPFRMTCALNGEVRGGCGADCKRFLCVFGSGSGVQIQTWIPPEPVNRHTTDPRHKPAAAHMWTRPSWAIVGQSEGTSNNDTSCQWAQ